MGSADTVGMVISSPPRPTTVTVAAELSVAHVDLDAIAANTRWFAARADGAALMAVVKADAFGHGAGAIARTALSAGASWLGVAHVREGIELRQSGVEAPILAWVLDPGRLGEAIDHGLDLSASSVEDLDAIASVSSSRCASVHLKLDTGLHRAGASVDAWPAMVRRAARMEAMGALRVRGIWSHLSHGDVPDHPANDRQQAQFADGLEHARHVGLRPAVTHLANSGAVTQLGAAGCSMVRVGAGLYGIDVFRGQGPFGARIAIRPSLTLEARVVGVRHVPAGAGIGYGHDTVSARGTTLALVPLGYADGLPRAAAGRASMTVAGRRVAVAGRISMDLTILDVGDLPVRVGDRVGVIGDGRDSTPTVADWASWAATIPHEILTHIGSRVRRRYLGGVA